MTEHTPIQSWPGYEITEDGRVFSIAHGWRGYGEREMSQTTNACGYLSVRLTKNGCRKRVTVHSLVAETFLPPAPPIKDVQIRHLNGDRLENRAGNLQWGSALDNAADREAHGRTSRGSQHSQAIKHGQQGWLAKIRKEPEYVE